MAKSDKRVNSPENTDALSLKREEELTEAGELIDNKEQSIREKVADTFDHYPEEEHLWVVVEDDSCTSFLSKDLSPAQNYAKSVKRKILKVTR